jgi:hypothetical protein
MSDTQHDPPQTPFDPIEFLGRLAARHLHGPERHDLQRISDKLVQLLQFYGDVMAGCDVQRGEKLYRQVEVLQGPGATVEQLACWQLAGQVDALQNERRGLRVQVTELRARLQDAIELVTDTRGVTTERIKGNVKWWKEILEETR